MTMKVSIKNEEQAGTSYALVISRVGYPDTILQPQESTVVWFSSGVDYTLSETPAVGYVSETTGCAASEPCNDTQPSEGVANNG